LRGASRSLEKVTPQKIDQLINDLIQKRIEDHQLDDCDLTLARDKEIAESFKFTLRSMLHSRIGISRRGSSVKEPPKAVTPEADAPPVWLHRPVKHQNHFSPPA